jgi:23S rRNA (pseudouridine1915-N3)-methyltransferase
MKIRLLAVGRPRDRALDERVEDYGRRIARFGVDWTTASVREVQAGKRYTERHAREREGAALLEAAGTRGTLVALDPGGRAWSSEDLGARIERWAMPEATFAIGGPSGLDRAVLERAEAVWSLSALTLPHELARLIVAEQVYRALTIARNVPYHKA